jgi:hypothetical protein
MFSGTGRAFPAMHFAGARQKDMKTALNNLLKRQGFKGLSFPALVVVSVAVGLLAAMVIPVTVR